MVTLYRKFPGALTFEKLFKDPFFNDPGSLRNRMRQDMGGMGVYICIHMYVRILIRMYVCMYEAEAEAGVAPHAQGAYTRHT